MTRPCFLVIDREYASSISTRKLVIETAKLNVITAYTSAEAIETLHRFPAVNGVVMDASMPDMPCNELARALKAIQPKIILIAISGPGKDWCDGADHHVESFDPAQLLNLLHRLVPEDSAKIEAQNEKLNIER